MKTITMLTLLLANGLQATTTYQVTAGYVTLFRNDFGAINFSGSNVSSTGFHSNGFDALELCLPCQTGSTLSVHLLTTDSDLSSTTTVAGNPYVLQYIEFTGPGILISGGPGV
jgi:hypothetical protein